MRRWYEPRKDRPDLERSAIRKRGFVGYMDMLWREFFELLKLNLLFVLSCVPIITIPAALTAMHRITSVMVRDENHFLWPDYWKAFRRDFWKSLGGGAAIKIKDASVLCSKVIVDGLTALAEADKIPYQYEILVAGGTDTSSMQTAGAGAHAGAVSIPTRYVHSPVEVVDAKDLDACVKLLRAAVERGINAEK